MAKEIFISYSRKDFDKVKAIKDEIDRELGIDCWMDITGIESGQQFEDVIIKAINGHDTFLFMLSPNSMNSVWALDELDFAQMKGKRVVLLFIEPCQMTDKFYFRYHKYDTIEWTNPLQHGKLLDNMRSWYNLTQEAASPMEPMKQECSPEAEEHWRLGMAYYNGDGVEQDDDQAFYWFQKAAEQGHPEAQNMLGDCYNFGLFLKVNEDENQAFFWYQKAAEQGNSNSQCNLGYCYANGTGVEQDHKQAVYWFKKAAEQGDEDAINWLKENNISY